jgi:hypothetical protein
MSGQTGLGFTTWQRITQRVKPQLRLWLSDSETLRVSYADLSLGGYSSQCTDANLFKNAFEDAQATNAKNSGSTEGASQETVTPLTVNVGG